jgi:hypothetical protein
MVKLAGKTISAWTNGNTYLCERLLDRRRLYVVWYSGEFDGLVRLKDRAIASFADEHQVRAFCRENGISLMLEPPAVCDFDKVAAWCGNPAAGSIEPAPFLNAWNMLEDARGSRLDVHLHDVSSQRAGKIYDKLFFANNLLAVTPRDASYEPIWSEDEVELLSRIYRFGLAELRASIQDISH